MERSALNVTYSLAFEEVQARVEMGLTPEQYEALPGTPAWVDPDNPTLSKCDVLAWYRLSKLIPAVMQAAEAKKAKRR